MFINSKSQTSHFFTENTHLTFLRFTPLLHRTKITFSKFSKCSLQHFPKIHISTIQSIVNDITLNLFPISLWKIPVAEYTHLVIDFAGEDPCLYSLLTILWNLYAKVTVDKHDFNLISKTSSFHLK